MKGMEIEAVLALTLTVGAVASASLITVGLGSYYYSKGNLSLNNPLSAKDLFSLLGSGFWKLDTNRSSPRSLIDLGIAILMLTPYVSVAASTVGFLVQKNLQYAAMGGLVWIILSYSLLVR